MSIHCRREWKVHPRNRLKEVIMAKSVLSTVELEAVSGGRFSSGTKFVNLTNQTNLVYVLGAGAATFGVNNSGGINVMQGNTALNYNLAGYQAS